MLSLLELEPSPVSQSNLTDKYLSPKLFINTPQTPQPFQTPLRQSDFMDIMDPMLTLTTTTSSTEALGSGSIFPALFSSAQSQSIAIGFFYSVLIITSLVSNPLLIYVLLWRRKAQIKLIDIFVANLSLSDLFLTIFNIPLCLIIYFSEQWPFGSLVCQLGTYSTSCSIYVNIFTMAYISIDRYFAVTRPLISNPLNYQLRKKSILIDCQTRRKIYLVLALIWIISLLLSLPQLLFSKVSTTDLYSGNAIKSSSLKPTNISQDQLLLDSDLDSIDPDSYLYDDLLALGTENLVEDPFKRCILDYPYKNMKNFMVIINFSLQFLIPSIVILYFYGKIIYHLYLNLNVEEFMDQPPPSHHHHHNSHDKVEKNSSVGGASGGDKARSTLDLRLNAHNKIHNKLQTSVSNDLRLSESELYEKSRASAASCNSSSRVNLERKRSRMRIEGLNRTRNLKKSIKTMVIIIALFLFSWLPIHLYRLTTTFYPILVSLFGGNGASTANRVINFKQGTLNVTNLLNNNIMISSSPLNLPPLGSGRGANSFEDLGQLIFLNMTYPSQQIFLPGLGSLGGPSSGGSGSGGSGSGGRSSPTSCSNITYSDCLFNVLKGLRELNDTSALAAYEINTLHNRYVFFFCYFFAMCSVCYNPIVYFWMHKKFREEVKQLFQRLFYRLVLFKSSAQINRIMQQKQQQRQQRRTTGAPTATNDRLKENNNNTTQPPSQATPHTNSSKYKTRNNHNHNQNQNQQQQSQPLNNSTKRTTPTPPIQQQQSLGSLPSPQRYQRRQSSIATTNTTATALTTATTATATSPPANRQSLVVSTTTELLDHPRRSIESQPASNWRFNFAKNFLSNPKSSGDRRSPGLVDSIRIKSKRFNSLSSCESSSKQLDIINLRT